MANHDDPLPVALIGIAGMLSLAAAMGVGRFAFTPMLPLMIAEGRIDIATGGWLAAANYAGYLAGALTAARLRIDARILCVVALVLVVVLTAAMALPAAGAGWLLLRFAAGAASAWVFVATSVWCLGALARRGAAQWGGGVYAGVGVGIAAAGMWCWAGGELAVSSPSQWLQLGGLALVLSLAVAAVLRRVPAAPPAADVRPRGAPQRGTVGLVVCYGIFGFGYILPATFLPVLARAAMPDAHLFGLAWPVFGAIAALSTLVAGALTRRATRLQVWAGSHWVMGIGVLLPSLWQGSLAIALSALLVGGTFMVVTMVGVQEVRARATGDPTRLVARLTAAFALGQIAGPIASSLLVHSGTGEMRGLHIALQAGALALFASAAWVWRQHPPRESTKEISHATR
jgi:predicted MFS family arabinose efflux permease